MGNQISKCIYCLQPIENLEMTVTLLYLTGSDAKKPRVCSLLLHNWELQNSGLWLLHEGQALQRPCLCCLFFTLLLESNAGKITYKSLNLVLSQ